MKHWTRLAIAFLAAPALVACGGEEEAPEVMEQPADAMGGMQMDGGMMEEMQAHMQRMQGVSGAQMQASMAQHRQMVANMVSRYGREMREMMPMEEGSEWNQTLEAIRQDLRQMPQMSAQELESFMPEHRQRIMRLMEMHREMMASMQM